MAWQHISPEVSVQGFKKCCVSNATDETDDGIMWNSWEEDENVRGECEGDEGTNCEDGESDTDW
jgi:hypothetical protein